MISERDRRWEERRQQHVRAAQPPPASFEERERQRREYEQGLASQREANSHQQHQQHQQHQHHQQQLLERYSAAPSLQQPNQSVAQAIMTQQEERANAQRAYEEKRRRALGQQPDLPPPGVTAGLPGQQQLPGFPGPGAMPQPLSKPGFAVPAAPPHERHRGRPVFDQPMQSPERGFIHGMGTGDPAAPSGGCVPRSSSNFSS